MAAFVLDFDPEVHLKVRHNDQLYVVFLRDYDFFKLPPDAEVVVHFISHNRIIFQDDEAIRQLYTVRKRELIIVESTAAE